MAQNLRNSDPHSGLSWPLWDVPPHPASLRGWGTPSMQRESLPKRACFSPVIPHARRWNHSMGLRGWPPQGKGLSPMNTSELKTGYRRSMFQPSSATWRLSTLVSSVSYSEQRGAGLLGLPKGFHGLCSLFRISPALGIPASPTEARHGLLSRSWDRLGETGQRLLSPSTHTAVCPQPTANGTRDLCTFHWLAGWLAGLCFTSRKTRPQGRKKTEGSYTQLKLRQNSRHFHASCQCHSLVMMG